MTDKSPLNYPFTDELDYPRLVVAKVIARSISHLVGKESSPSGDSDVHSIYRTIERPPESHLGDYAFPCFRFARLLKKNPAMIANDLSSLIQGEFASDWIASVDVVGAFLNIKCHPVKLATYLVNDIRNGHYLQRCQKALGSTPDKVMIEYSQPNTHKIFHVGHMRNVALGDSLGRILEFCGHPVVFANYIGDEGAHIAKCIWYIKKFDQKVPADRRGEWLGDMYAKATNKISEADSELRQQYDKEVSEVLRAIESKKGDLYEFWRESREWSLSDFHEVYDWTGARFDHFFYESDVSEESQQIVDEYLDKEVFVLDDGAVGIDLKEEKLGFLIVRKSDGNTTYGTKDLALARRKFRDFAIDQSIYVVASEQNLHFKQVFKTLEKMGFDNASKCHHLSYGMVVLPEGKMSSRTGNVIAFNDMRHRLAEELGKQLRKYEGDWEQERIDDVSHKLAVGAVRYGMICSDPVKDIVFDLENWLSFEGNTGPYLMYSYARTRSILAKAKAQGYEADEACLSAIGNQEEIDLMRHMNDLNGAIAFAAEQKKPSCLAHHLFDMCKAYNRFLAQVSVLKAESDKARSARLCLLESFSLILKAGLNLLGMTPPEKM